MDKQQNSKPKNSSNLLKMLPKAMSFGQSLAPFSPGRDLHHHHTSSTAAAAGNRAFFSGPIVRLVPVEARVRRSRNEGVSEEPTSPKVSCIGQISLAKSKCSEKKQKNRASPRNPKTTSPSHSKNEDKRRPSIIKRMFSSTAASKPPRKPHPTSAAAAAAATSTAAVTSNQPSLGHMKKFASSREALADFDWTVEMNQEESPAEYRRREYDSDDETRVIAYSAPLSLNGTAGLKPKKEVNLWKRRTMDPPRPLQIKES